jgi:Putative auto-transporter adhesin, head GIN domain
MAASLRLLRKAAIFPSEGIPMKRILAMTACAFALPGISLAATKTYSTGGFEEISVSAGIVAHITLGPAQSIVAETAADTFEDVQITVVGKELRIGRPNRNWFLGLFSWSRTKYQVHVVTPVLHSLAASSGAKVTVRGTLEGDFAVKASSGSEVDVSGVKGGNVQASISSGSDLDIAGSCISLDAHASSGSDLDAKALNCENVSVHTSSGSDVSVTATKRLTGNASSGSDIIVSGKPALVQVEKSSGADVTVRD